MRHGEQITDKHLITHAFLAHYEHLLGVAEPISPLDLSPLYEQPVNLSQLDAPFSVLEVHQAVRQLAPNKASGPDGLPNEFAKLKWNTIQPYVMQIFHKLYTQQIDLTDMNEATIVLLPKHDAALTVTDYRPISMINLIPKLISKVLANRICPYLPHLVNEHQTAFVHGRFIAENFLATREVLRHVHRTKSPTVLLKLDFAKAYDTLDWNFLTRVLQIRGFPDRPVQWILHVLSTASSRILINGQLSGSFKHKRGLRQGDPLSPYLFIIAADVFQKMTEKISLASLHRLSPRLLTPIINFQYADDTVLIVAAKGQNLHRLVLVIHCFTSGSGLRVNFDKSSFVPIAIQDHLFDPIQQLLQCNQSSLPLKYLGMPLTINRPTKMDFMPLLDKMERRLQGWKARLISRAGRLQLVKSVLSAIPMYFMSCFKLPKWLLDRIDAVRRQFLWSRDTNVQAIHLINWQTACLPMKCGGLGIVNLHTQNMALLLRWWWRLYAGDHKLWATYASRIYARWPNPDGPLILSSSGSFFWKSLLRLRPVFSSAAKFQIFSGKKVSFWFDAWCGQLIAASMSGTLTNRNISLHDAKQRVQRLLPRPLTFHHSQVIQSILHLTLLPGTDKLVWNLAASGQFSTKSIYKVLSEGGKVLSDTASIWRVAVTPSMRFFFYLFLNHRLLTHEVMQRRNLIYQPGCVMCGRQDQECVMHLFFTCPYACSIWSVLANFSGYNVIVIADYALNTYRGSIPNDRDRRRPWTSLFISALWLLWRERNTRTFRNTSMPAHILAGKIWDETNLYLRQCT